MKFNTAFTLMEEQPGHLYAGHGSTLELEPNGAYLRTGAAHLWLDMEGDDPEGTFTLSRKIEGGYLIFSTPRDLQTMGAGLLIRSHTDWPVTIASSDEREIARLLLETEQGDPGNAQVEMFRAFLSLRLSALTDLTILRRERLLRGAA